jgi:hypothetical protein
MNISIAGGGWFAMITADFFIKRGYNVDIYTPDIFDGSSRYNQNRLHVGYHYARSKVTRDLCLRSFHLLKSMFPFAIKKLDKNYYGIAKSSIIDSDTYLDIFRKFEHHRVVQAEIPIHNVDTVIEVDEMYIDHNTMKEHWEGKMRKRIVGNKVHGFSQKDNKVIINDEKEYDLFFDCTNNQMGLIKNIVSENTISLIYKSNDENTIGVTIVDGNFVSLYPYDLESRLYTLTSVLHTPLHKEPSPDVVMKKREKMEEEIRTFIPEYFEKFTYDSYFVSKKSKPITGCDSRELMVSKNERVTSIACCKIGGVIMLLDYLEKTYGNITEMEA